MGAPAVRGGDSFALGAAGRQIADHVSLVKVGVQNVYIVFFDVFSKLGDGGKAEFSLGFENLCFETELRGFPAEGDFEILGILYGGDGGFDPGGIEVLDESEDPAFGAVEAGGTAEMENG